MALFSWLCLTGNARKAFEINNSNVFLLELKTSYRKAITPDAVANSGSQRVKSSKTPLLHIPPGWK